MPSCNTNYCGLLLIAGLMAACVNTKNFEATTPGVDPYAPAVPELVAGDSGATEQSEPYSPQRVGSEDPVVVDSLTSEGETPSQATQDYIDAFNDRPDYKPAAVESDAPKKSPKRGNSPEPIEGDGAEKMVVNIQRINIRSKPNRFSKIVGELRKGDVIMVDIDKAIGWGKISAGRYIRARHLKSAKE